jgi:low affinity Fe/Cu permease
MTGRPDLGTRKALTGSDILLRFLFWTTMKSTSFFTRFAKWTSRAAGQPVAFAIALGALLLWAVTGPVFGFSDTWQLIINTGTTIVTFLMVFLIQNTQNRDSEAIHIKLDELIRSHKTAHNALLDLEELEEEELDRIRSSYEQLAEQARSESKRRKPAKSKTGEGGIKGS